MCQLILKIRTCHLNITSDSWRLKFQRYPWHNHKSWEKDDTHPAKLSSLTFVGRNVQDVLFFSGDLTAVSHKLKNNLKIQIIFFRIVLYQMMSARIANESQMNWNQYLNHATVRPFCQHCETACALSIICLSKLFFMLAAKYEKYAGCIFFSFITKFGDIKCSQCLNQGTKKGTRQANIMALP